MNIALPTIGTVFSVGDEKGDIPLFSVRVEVFGRKTGNWSIRHVKEKRDMPNYPLARKRVRTICTIAAIRGAKCVIAPIPSRLSGTVIAARNVPPEGVIRLTPPFLRGIYADGAFLGRNEAFFMASADCPIVVLVGTQSGIVAALHGGRDAIIDRSAAEKGIPSRRYESVVDAALARFPDEPDAIFAFIGFGIGARHFRHPFGHPVHGKRNRALVSYLMHKYGCVVRGAEEEGCIDLSEIIFRQIVRHKIPACNIKRDGADTFSDKDASGEYRFWSHARGDDGRNGILVTRK